MKKEDNIVAILIFHKMCIFDRRKLLFAFRPTFFSCRFGFDSELGQTNDFKIGIHSFPA